MSFVAEPYERFVDDLLTALTGGVIREEHQFTGVDSPYGLASRTARPDTVKVFGQRNEAFNLFDRGVDYDFDVANATVVWKARGRLPDDHSYFYVNYYRPEDIPTLTDRNPGSVTTTLAEAFARELAVLHRQMDGIYRSAFVDMATDTALDHVVALLGVARRDARFATGQIVFKRGTPAPGDVTIPAGTVISTDQGQNFETTDERRLRKGQLAVEVPIRAQVDGPPGKVAVGAIKNVNRPIFGIESVVNEAETVFATQRESDEDLRRRLKGTIERAGKSTVDAIKYALTDSGPEITEANLQITERSDVAGLVDVKIGVEAPDEKLVQRVEAAIFSARPAGVRVAHNLPTASESGQAGGLGITREQATADFKAQNEPSDVNYLSDDVFVAMPQGVLNLRVEAFLRLAEANLSAAQKETIEGAARQVVSDYVSALPMGAPLLFNKLLGRIVAPDAIVDAALLVGAESNGSFLSFRGNLATHPRNSSDGRKAKIDDYHIFVGLMDEPVSVEVTVTVESKNQAVADAGPLQDAIKPDGPLYRGLTAAITRLLADARGQGSLARGAVVEATRPLLDAASPPLQIVEAKGVVVSAKYVESGRLVNDADQVTIQENELPTLGKLSLKLKSNLDG